MHAVVLKWSRSRKRYERQGLLVDEASLAQAEAECLADDNVRRRRRERQAEQRADLDEAYVARFARRVRELYPACPDREQSIAEFSCRKYSGRVGRCAAAKQLDEDAVRLAVIAHVRHVETNYDELLGQGLERRAARESVQERIEQVLSKSKDEGRTLD